MNVTSSIVARRWIGSVPFCGIWSGQTVLDRFCNRLGSTPAQYEWISSFSHLHKLQSSVGVQLTKRRADFVTLDDATFLPQDFGGTQERKSGRYGKLLD